MRKLAVHVVTSSYARWQYVKKINVNFIIESGRQERCILYIVISRHDLYTLHTAIKADIYFNLIDLWNPRNQLGKLELLGNRTKQNEITVEFR